MTLPDAAPFSAVAPLGVPPLINACGIYTDLGGSVLSPTVWAAATAANAAFASLPDLLDRSGELIAELVDAPAARVVPGASAAIALSVAACIARMDGKRMETLPHTDDAPDEVLLQHGHRYKYARCATLAGARLVEVGGPDGTTADELAAAIGPRTAAILLPVHLDAANGTLPLDEVVRIAHDRSVPVIVDAAYMSYPVDLLKQYTAVGADLTCFSAKYFWGPNAGGFVCGDADLMAAVRAIDFTGYESGRWLTFGRVFKLDRATVVATTVALQEWVAMDHDARWEGYRTRAEHLAERVSGAATDVARVAPACFTLDERIVDSPVNSLVLTLIDPAGDAGALAGHLAAGTPSIRAVPEGRQLVLCLETVDPADDELLAVRVAEALGAVA
ncbi:aminotransferase class V-fold PLP-dependent enzyme [Nonomuraea sp. NPDC002799]